MHLTLPGKQHATNETATKDVYEPWNRIQPMREPEATQTQTLTSRLQNQISFLCYSLTLHQFIATLSFGNSMVQSWAKPSLINCQSRSPKPSIPQGSKAPAKQSWHSRPWLNRNHIPNTPQKPMLGDTEKWIKPYPKQNPHSTLNYRTSSIYPAMSSYETRSYGNTSCEGPPSPLAPLGAIPIGSIGFISWLGAGYKEQWNASNGRKTIEASTKPAKPNKKWMLL